MKESDFKQRMIGAIVLIALGVIFIPILLNGESDDGMPIFGSNIPDRHNSITQMKPLKLSSNISPPETKPIETILVDQLSPEVTNKNNKNEVVTAALKSVETNTTNENPVKLAPNNKKKVTKPTDTKTTKTATKSLKAIAWVIQVGSFTHKKNAIALQNKLRTKNYHAFVEAVKKQSEISYRVRIGPEVLKASAETTKKRLKKEMKINGIILKHKG